MFGLENPVVLVGRIAAFEVKLKSANSFLGSVDVALVLFSSSVSRPTTAHIFFNSLH